jgi:hypothetical protein
VLQVAGGGCGGGGGGGFFFAAAGVTSSDAIAADGRTIETEEPLRTFASLF